MTKTLPLILAIIAVFSCTADRGLSGAAGAATGAAIFLPGGKIPATGALVKIFDIFSLETKPAAIACTDAQGRYLFDNLPYGFYTIAAEKDSLVLYQDSVLIAATSTTIRSDTLEFSLSLRGIVGVEPMHDPRTVTVLLKGCGRRAAVDEGGNFTFAGMTGGVYSLVLRSSLPDYMPLTPTVQVVGSGPVISIADTFQLVYLGLPAVAGIRAFLDTASGVVHFFWNGTDYKNMHDYVLFRDSCNAAGPSTFPYRVTTDTCFLDSAFAVTPSGTRAPAGRCLSYRIAVRDKLQRIGPIVRCLEFSIRAAMPEASP
jgi:hypothetical protein